MKRISYYLPIALLACSFVSCGQAISTQKVHSTVKTIAADSKPNDLTKYSQATFAAGCFWHEELLYESIKGVTEAVSGYAGGHTKNPSYESLETGNTGHTETVNVYYDSTKITYPQLVKIFFQAQEDPTDAGGQGPDRGSQYRSIVFYRNAKEKEVIDNEIKALNASGKYRKSIAAEVTPYTVFYKAEDYHQDYIANNPDNPYVQNVSIPDVRHYQEQHPEMIKAGHSFVGK